MAFRTNKSIVTLMIKNGDTLSLLFNESSSTCKKNRQNSNLYAFHFFEVQLKITQDFGLWYFFSAPCSTANFSHLHFSASTFWPFRLDYLLSCFRFFRLTF